MTITKDTKVWYANAKTNTKVIGVEAFLEEISIWNTNPLSQNHLITSDYKNLLVYGKDKKSYLRIYNSIDWNISISNTYHKAIRISKTHSIFLTSNLAYLSPAIEESLSILSLKDDWDGEWSDWYSAETLYQAIKFLISYAEWYAKNWKKIFPPKMYNAGSWSVDLLWENNDAILLINIQKNGKDWAFFTKKKVWHPNLKWNFKVDKENYLIIPFLFEE